MELTVPTDYVTHKLKGFGTVTFLMPEHAVLAYSELDGTVFHGRMLHLLPGKAKDTENNNEGLYVRKLKWIYVVSFCCCCR